MGWPMQPVKGLNAWAWLEAKAKAARLNATAAPFNSARRKLNIAKLLE
jgi:hypothetical protein